MPNGFLLVMMHPPPAFEEEFNEWYDTDHLPERLAVPGFLTARRFVCLDGWPRFLALYDLTDVAVLASPAYLSVSVDKHTPWTRRVLRHVRVNRYIGSQTQPGDTITTDAPRLLLLRFANTKTADEASILAGLTMNFAENPATMQIRVLTSPDDKVAFGLVESRLPIDPKQIQLSAFEAAKKLDLVNSYVRY